MLNGKEVLKYLETHELSAGDLAHTFHVDRAKMASMMSYYARMEKVKSRTNDQGLTLYKSVNVSAPPVDLNNVVEVMSSKIVDQIMVRVMDELERRLVELPIDYTAIIEKLKQPRKVEEVRVRLPKVGVVGLLPIQCGKLMEDYGNLFDFHFWCDESVAKLKSIGDNCGVVFLHVRHGSHSTDAILKSHSCKLIRVPGGLSAMCQAIDTHFKETYAG